MFLTSAMWQAVRGVPLLTLCYLVGCATLGEKNTQQLSGAGAAKAEDFTDVAAVATSSFVNYKFGSSSEKAEWIDCRLKQGTPKATILLMHSDRAGFDKTKFCGGWIAQAFLTSGIEVVTVNRPGYGGSTGIPDFSGARSLAAIQVAVVDALAKSGNPAPLTGAWGYESGATAAAIFSRHLPPGMPALKFLILGAGLYDYEAVAKSTSDDYLKADTLTIKKTGGDKAIEDRSVGYDVAGLPASLIIYHGKNDTVAPFGQAKAFVDSLESSGKYHVNFQAIDGLGHELSWTQHRKIIEELVRTAVGT